MSEMVKLYKGDSVTTVPAGSEVEAKFIADGFSRVKEEVEPEPDEEEAPVGLGRGRRKRSVER